MSKAIRKEIEKATFLDGKGKKIIRIGEGLDIDYGDHCDDRNIMCFFTHRWLPRLKKMETATEVEKQIDDFFNKIPSLAGTEEERKIMIQLRELGLGRKMVLAPVAEAMMNNIRLSDFNNNNGMFNNEGKLIYLPNNSSNGAAAASKGGRRRRKKRKKRKKRRTRKEINKIRMKDPKYCCAGPGCPDYKHCITVLGDKDSGIRPKSPKTLKIMERCSKRYSEMGKNYKKCIKRERKTRKHKTHKHKKRHRRGTSKRR